MAILGIKGRYSISSEFSDRHSYVILAFIWLICAILIDPRGDFPIMDDWSYATAARNLAESGEYQLTEWTAMTLFTQVLFGAAAVKIFGFSFTVLRIFTLFAGLIAIFGLYRLVNQFLEDYLKSFFAALIIMFNPFFLPLSYSFFSDIPFVAFSFWSVFFLVRYVETDRLVFWFVGIFLSIAAILTRETGLAIPAGFSLALIFMRNKRQRLLIIAVSVIIPLASYFAYLLWLESLGKLPQLFGDGLERLKITFNKGVQYSIFSILKNIFLLIVFTGLYLSPLILGRNGNFLKLLKQKRKFIVIFILYISLFGFIFVKDRFLESGAFHMLEIYLNPTMMENIHSPSKDMLLIFGNQAASIILFAGYTLGGILIILLWNEIFEKRNTEPVSGNKSLRMILYMSIIYFIPISLATGFSRYFIFLMPAILILIFHYLYKDKLKFKIEQWLLSIFIAYVSISATRDILKINEKIDEGMKYLFLKGIPAEKIDAGFEFTAWHNYEPDYDLERKDKNWWWVNDDEYLISYGKAKNYRIINEFPYTRWIPPGYSGKIYVMKKK